MCNLPLNPDLRNLQKKHCLLVFLSLNDTTSTFTEINYKVKCKGPCMKADLLLFIIYRPYAKWFLQKLNTRKIHLHWTQPSEK